MKTAFTLEYILLLFVICINNVPAAEVVVDLISGGGVDNQLNVDIGTSFDVDIILNNALELAGFELALDFNSTMLTATSIISGEIFNPSTLLLDKTIHSGSITFAESTTLFPVSISTATILATISFDVIGSGGDFLTLNNVSLTDSAFSNITPVNLSNAEVNVVSVPAPGIFILMFSGFSFLRLYRKYCIAG